MRWFDTHNHLQDSRLGSNQRDLIEKQIASGVVGCVVNATSEQDWEKVGALAREFPDFIRPAFGIHPWKALTAKPGWQDRLRSLLAEFPNAGIGECGLDTWVASPDIEKQIPLFIEHLQIARETERPLTIHCLKAWCHLFDCFREQSPAPGFLMHSFGGSAEIARDLTKAGAYFSLSGYALHPRKRKLIDTFLTIPRERLLVETDAPDMLPPAEAISHPLEGGHNHPANLPGIGKLHVDSLRISHKEWSETTLENTDKWLGK